MEQDLVDVDLRRSIGNSVEAPIENIEMEQYERYEFLFNVTALLDTF
jgi:hypothetical protein